MSRSRKQPKTGAKAVDSHCQNNGHCDWCLTQRTIASQRQESKAVLSLREYLQTTPQEKLNEIYSRVKAMNLQGPTLQELICLNRKAGQAWGETN